LGVAADPHRGRRVLRHHRVSMGPYLNY